MSEQSLHSAERSSKHPRACIVRYDYHPGDSRIENQSQALYEDGFQVDILCMRMKGEPFTAVANGVRIIRLPSLTRFRGNLLLYAAEYATFWIITFLALCILYPWRRYAVVQVCNLPDFLVFSALIPKLFGAKILIDHRESMVEMYTAKFEISPESRPIRLLANVEQACVRFSDRVVTCTDQMKNATVARGTPSDKVFVLLNSVDPAKFHHPDFPDPASPIGTEFVIMTHGSIIPRYGHETLIRSMAILRHEAPEARLLILGDGHNRPEMEALAGSLELTDIIQFRGFVPYSELLEHLRTAHVGAVTMMRNAETDLIHTIKMQEYMVQGLPIVISRTSAVEGYFDETMVQFFDSGDPADLAASFLRLRNKPALRRELALNAYERCERFYKTSDQKRNFVTMVRDLVA